MMIEKSAFSAGMGILANNFNKTVDAALSRVWYNVLSAQLTTEQFETAVALSIAQDTFWPTAASLMAKVAPETDETRGLMALEHVNRVLSECGGYRFLSYDRSQQEFDAATWAGISAVGGLWEISGCPIERYGTLSRKFAAAYAKHLNPTPLLATPAVDPRVKRLAATTARTLSISGRDRALGKDA